MLMDELVQLEDISKGYTNKNVLHHISLEINKNQIVAILGGNGVGKSTLLRIIAGIQRPSSGKVNYYNKAINIGYVPERFPNLIRFTPGEYLNYIGKISGIPESLRNRTISDFLHRFQLEELNNQWVMNLSKGSIQKVGIIQAIMQKPGLLILDEPISGLDSHAQQELIGIMKELKEEGTTVLLTYHESNILENVVDTAYNLNNGHLSKTNAALQKESIKLLSVENIADSYVIQWNEVLYMEKRGNSLLLFVHLRNSDKILYRILQLQGSIRSVETIDTLKGKFQE
ncbi:ABC transporter ATP-binding protein [Virgibacillus sp. NKC19-3]|uniref:ABC transporter ATP-binding protein n=1 Tax=Virgibacillus saliphilus TaxID=2831674 RepID=UPI001C9AB618|nr:ABC transporter ATP-binding protein [Virgibacillus sp. NKC19-3]MBY7142007.1 ABC transporter ATP-binding protein [Virgibacillus sp. NKC19-3]